MSIPETLVKSGSSGNNRVATAIDCAIEQSLCDLTFNQRKRKVLPRFISTITQLAQAFLSFPVRVFDSGLVG